MFRTSFLYSGFMESDMKLLNETNELSQKLTDVKVLKKINDIKNIGKRVEMCVSSTILLDTFGAFNEYCELVNKPDGIEKHKVSLSLLTRCIFESYVTFLYIFKCKKGQTQIRARAFYHYGEYKKGKMQNREDLSEEEQEWSKYIPQKGKKSQWHGKTFQDLSDETGYAPIVYQALSQFTHPGIFTMERILLTPMFKGMMDDSVIFTSAAICDMVSYAHNLKLYGLKQKTSNEKEINELVKKHDEAFVALKKSREKKVPNPI